MVSITLFQPDIPQNTGTIMRLCACFDTPLHLIEPLGFALSERKLKRSAMDYIHYLNLSRHESWDSYMEKTKNNGRKILFTTKTNHSLWDFNFKSDDILVFGNESKGAPAEVHSSVDYEITIPIAAELRSLNLATAASIALGEAMRQTT